MELVFWSAVALVFYGYAGYPLLLFVISLWRDRSVTTTPILPKVSLIISVHNGEKIIGGKIANSLSLDYPPERFDIIVASDGSTDGTNDLVRQVNDPRVHLVTTYPRGGKEMAQKEAIAVAGGQIIAFTDVGVLLQPNALRALVSNFADPTVGCVSGVDRVVQQQRAEGRDLILTRRTLCLRGEASGNFARDAEVAERRLCDLRASVVKHPNPIGSPEARSGEGFFVRYETWIKLLESRVGCVVGNSGWLFAVRRSLCEQWPSDMASDFTMVLRSVSRGYRAIVEPQAVGYAHTTASASVEFERKVRTIVRGMVVLAAHKAMLNPFRYGFFSIQLLSHKILRWSLPFLMLFILGSNLVLGLDSGLYRVTLTLQTTVYMIAMLLPSAGLAHSFLAFNFAALVAWWKFLTGEKFVVWEPTPRVVGRGWR